MMLFALVFSLAAAVFAAQCSDGTYYNHCSEDNPGMVCAGSFSSPELKEDDTLFKFFYERGDSDCICPEGETIVDGVCVSAECSDGTELGECSDSKPKYCEDGGLVDKASVCGCPVGYERDEERCIQLVGCEYDNPSCDEDHECIDNVCVLKTGCEYENPSCASDEECINNVCVEKTGCLYGKPECSWDEVCENNVCVKREGCEFENPPCGEGEICVQNTCVQQEETDGDSALNMFGEPDFNPLRSCCCVPALVALAVLGVTFYKKE